RRGKPLLELSSEPVAVDIAPGVLAAWVMLDPTQPRFERFTVLRKALQLLLAEQPVRLSIALFGTTEQRREAAQLAVYTAWVNGASLPVRKQGKQPRCLESITVYGYRTADGHGSVRAQAEG